MAAYWDSECVEILRVLVDDMGTTPLHSDDKLRRVLVVSAFQVLQEASFSQEFVVDIDAMSITPDPGDNVSATSTRDDSYLNLICLKAACIMDRGAAVNAARKAMHVRDGGSWLDAREVGKHRIALLEKGYCATYEQEKNDYLSGQSSVAGAMVLTPFRIHAGSGPIDGRGRVIAY